MIPALFMSPFIGDFDYSKSAIPRCIGIKKIEDLPVAEALVHYCPVGGSDLIKAGEGKYYGLAFFRYCLIKYGTEEEKKALHFTITLPMAAEALLYYGMKLWGDKSKSHPSIEPFRFVAQDYGIITVQLTYEPHH